jgi:hypothetical protein
MDGGRDVFFFGELAVFTYLGETQATCPWKKERARAGHIAKSGLGWVRYSHDLQLSISLSPPLPSASCLGLEAHVPPCSSTSFSAPSPQI